MLPGEGGQWKAEWARIVRQAEGGSGSQEQVGGHLLGPGNN